MKKPLILPDLPRELLDIIVAHVDDHATFKSLRLANHALSEVAERPLFREIVLISYKNCLEEFKTFFEQHPHLADAVQTVSYDAQWNEPLAYQLFKSVEGSPQQAQLKKAQDQAITSAEVDEETRLLGLVFQSLPNVRNVQVLDPPGAGGKAPYNSPPKYYQRMTDLTEPMKAGHNYFFDRSYNFGFGNMYSFHVGTASTAVMVVLSSRSSSIRALSSYAFDIMRMVDDTAQQVYGSVSLPKSHIDLSELKYLDLELGEDVSYASEYAMAFAVILCTAQKLETLVLELQAGYFEPEYSDQLEEMTSLIRCLNASNTTFRNLRSLSLEDIACGQTDLQEFLFRHKKLFNLRLDGLTLAGSPDTISCGVSFLQSLRDMHLESFTLENRLHNAGKQEMDFSCPTPYSDDAQDRARVQTADWVTRKTDEMPQLLQLLQVRPGKHDVDFTDLQQLNSEERRLIQDCTWGWIDELESAFGGDDDDEDSDDSDWETVDGSEVDDDEDTAEDPLEDEDGSRLENLFAEAW